MQDSKEVIAGIIDQAREEAKKIVADAESTVSVRRSALESRVKRVHAESEARTQTEVSRIENRYSSAIALERRRAELRLAQDVYRSIVERVRQRFRRMLCRPEYDAVLRGWIAEAVIGLGEQKCEIRVSKDEQDAAERVLEEASREASEVLGFTCAVSLNADVDVPQQGVVALSPDGATAYNNQLDTRLARYESDLRAVVADEVLNEEGSS